MPRWDSSRRRWHFKMYCTYIEALFELDGILSSLVSESWNFLLWYYYLHHHPLVGNQFSVSVCSSTVAYISKELSFWGITVLIYSDRTNFDLKIWWVWWNNGDKNNFEQLQFIGTVNLPPKSNISKLLGDIWLRVWNVSVTKRSFTNARNSWVDCTNAHEMLHLTLVFFIRDFRNK